MPLVWPRKGKKTKKKEKKRKLEGFKEAKIVKRGLKCIVRVTPIAFT